jgi:hypothetical protein
MKTTCFVSAAVVMCLGVGCSSGLHAVSGSVLVDGQPAMEGVQVIFTPVGDTKPAHGKVDGQGRFSLMTNQQRGVMPGKYRVLLINSSASISQPDTPIEPGVNVPPPEWIAYDRKLTEFLQNPPQGPGWIPKRYAALQDAPLSWTVPEDGVEATFEVQSEPSPSAR